MCARGRTRGRVVCVRCACAARVLRATYVLLRAEAANVQQQWRVHRAARQPRAHLLVVDIERGVEDVRVDALAPHVDLLAAELLQLLLELRATRSHDGGCGSWRWAASAR
eukprot:4708698-Prymnesium_polylepis.1